MSPLTLKHRHRRRGGPPAWGRGDSSVLVPAPCSVLLARAQEPPPAPCAPYPASPPFPWAMPKPLSALGIKRAGWKCSCECLGHGAAPHRGALELVGTPVTQIPMSLTLGVLVPPCPAVSGSQYPCVCWVLGSVHHICCVPGVFWGLAGLLCHCTTASCTTGAVLGCFLLAPCCLTGWQADDFRPNRAARLV